MKHFFFKFFLLLLFVAGVDVARAQISLGVNGIEFLGEADSLAISQQKSTVQASAIVMVRKDPSRRFTVGRSTLSTIPMVELGWNALSGVDYGLYDASKAGFLDLNNWKSTQVTVNLFQFGAYDHKNKLGITMGLGLRANNYRLDSSLSLIKQGELMVPCQIADFTTRSVKKSKLNIASVHLPVEVMIGKPTRFAFSLGGYIDMVMNSHTKVKFKGGHKEKGHNLPVNFIQAGATARFTFRWFSIYASYQPTQLFKSGRGPEAQQWTIGIGF